MRPALVVFAGCLVLYAPTVYPTVPGGDSGELVVVASALAVAHPPGYPLWTLLAKLFTLVPFGSIAERVAWLSAVCASAAAAVAFDCVVAASTRRDGKPDAAALAGGLVAAALFAFSPTVWTYAVGAEVFPLHCLFVALLCRLALAWEMTRDARVATAIAFTAGLGLANHHTLVLLAGPLVAWVLWSGRSVLLAPRRLATLAGAGLLGLLPYAYLWLAGLRENPLSWGDTATLQGFLDHLLRRDYGTFQLLPAGHEASSSFATKLFTYGSHVFCATLGTVALLVPLAIALTRRDAAGGARTRWIALLLASAGLYLGVFLWRANVPVHDPLLLAVLSRFWMQPDVILCIVTGVGFALAIRRVAGSSVALPWLLATALAIVRIGASGGDRMGAGGAVVEHYGRAILEPLPERTILLTSGDLVTNSVRYLQAADGLRPDIVVLDQELMTKPWYVRRMKAAHPDVAFPGDFYHPAAAGGFSMRAFLDANRATRPIWLYPDWKEGDPTVATNYKAWPEGLASRVETLASPPALSRWVTESGAALGDLYRHPWPPIDSEPEGSWERVALEDVWQARHRRALAILVEAIERNDDPRLLAIARGEFESAMRSHPNPPWFLWKNLGITYARLAPTTPGLRAQQLDAWRRYLATAPADDKDREAIAAEVARGQGS